MQHPPSKPNLGSTITSSSLAVAQRSLGPSGREFDLWPPLATGAPRAEDEGVDYPLEIVFDLTKVDPILFDDGISGGLARWAPLLPPLVLDLSIAEGGTPLIKSSFLERWSGAHGVLIKDESRNPTWSHKDRLNLCTVSAAVESDAPGIAVASSGNHGASAAAYAARAGLPCLVITSNGASRAAQAFMKAYGAAVISVPAESRQALLKRFVEATGFMPVSSITETHTGHPFGPEGYKTIAYELFVQLKRVVPAAVFVPTGYAELLFGIWKGFEELRRLRLIERIPRMVACEPAARGPLAKAISTGQPVARVDAQPTDAFSIACTVSSYRGISPIVASNGIAMTLTDSEISDAQSAMQKTGLWPEFSSAAGLAGVRKAIANGEQFDGPIVAVQTSCGFKDPVEPAEIVPQIEPEWELMMTVLRSHYRLQV